MCPGGKCNVQPLVDEQPGLRAGKRLHAAPHEHEQRTAVERGLADLDDVHTRTRGGSDTGHHPI